MKKISYQDCYLGEKQYPIILDSEERDRAIEADRSAIEHAIGLPKEGIGYFVRARVIKMVVLDDPRRGSSTQDYAMGVEFVIESKFPTVLD